MKASEIIASPRQALRRMGLSFRDQDSMNLRCHIATEGARFPLICVNGDLNFGFYVDESTGEFTGRTCICEARSGDVCICDLGDHGAVPHETPKDKTLNELRRLLYEIHIAKEMNNPDSPAWIELGRMFSDSGHN